MATITYLQLAKSSTDLSTYTFSSQNIGTAGADRYVICAISSRSVSGDQTISSVTIGGVSATLNAQLTNSGNTLGIATALVPTGTTGDVVVVFSSTMTNCDIALYNATGLSSATALDTGTSTANNGTTPLDIIAGGVAVALAKNDDGSQAATWTGLTEAYDEQDANTNDISGASDAFVSSDIGRTITCTWSGTPTRPTFVAASFVPSGIVVVGNKISDTNNDVFDDGTNIDLNGADELIIGEHPVLSIEYTGGFRFTGLAIPQGAVITEAKILLVNDANSVGTPSLAIQGDDADDSAIFSTHADFVGRTRTTASVAWTPGAQTAETKLTTIDIKDVVQEIVDRPGWTSGNDMSFFIKNNGGVNSWILVYDYTVNAANSAQIQIAYSTGLSVEAPIGSLTLTGYVPTLSYVDPVNVLPPLGTITLTGHAPTIQVGIWSNTQKNSSSWTNTSKNSSTWTNLDKSD